MKKYFLLMMLMTVVFLGLGNMAVGQIEIQTTPVNDVSTWDTNQSSSTAPDTQIFTTTSDDNQTPLGDVNATDVCSNMDNSRIPANNGSCSTGFTQEFVGGIICCNPDPSGVAGSDCRPPEGGTANSFGICSCPDGTKNVNNVCTPCNTEGVCCGISLNTSIPFIGDCIEDDKNNQGVGETNVTGETAFPVLMGSLTKILVSVILIISFVLIVVGGIMIATGDPSGGKKMIIKVVIGIALLGASGVILRLINPNFFG